MRTASLSMFPPGGATRRQNLLLRCVFFLTPIPGSSFQHPFTPIKQGFLKGVSPGSGRCACLSPGADLTEACGRFSTPWCTQLPIHLFIFTILFWHTCCFSCLNPAESGASCRAEKMTLYGEVRTQVKKYFINNLKRLTNPEDFLLTTDTCSL